MPTTPLRTQPRLSYPSSAAFLPAPAMSATLVVVVLRVDPGPTARPGAVAAALATLVTPLQAAGGVVHETRRDGALVAFEDRPDRPRRLDGLARALAMPSDVVARAAAHMGVRVRDGRRPDGAGLGARSVAHARSLATAARPGELLLSEELGTMIVLSRAGAAPFLTPARRPVEAIGTLSMYRFDPVETRGELRRA